MRRIIVDNNIRSIAKDYLKKIGLTKSKIDNKPCILRDKIFYNLQNFRDSIISAGQEKYIEYVDRIINNFNDLILMHPLMKHCWFTKSLTADEVKGKVTVVVINKDGTLVNETKDFSKSLVSALCYDEIRNKVFPEFMQKLGIKTCVYCNAQYAVTLKKDNCYHNSYTIDHFLNKDEYPCYAISFFNLVPACDQCNRFKSTDDVDFNLYALPGDNVDVFNFKLINGSEAKFLTTYNENDLEIALESSVKGLKTSHDNKFHIEAKYKSHVDEAATILLKKKFYNDAYLEQIKNQFNILFPGSVAEMHRYLWGYILSAEAVHSKPLTLLAQSLM